MEVRVFECPRVFSKLNVVGVLDLDVGRQHAYTDIMGWPNREGVDRTTCRKVVVPRLDP